VRGSLLFVVLPVLFACGGTSSELSHSVVEAGTLTVALKNRMGPPYRLERVVVTFDGAIALARLDRRSRSRRELLVIQRFDVSDGNHAMSAMVELSYPSGAIGERCRLIMRDSLAFSVEKAAAAVILDLRLASVQLDFANRPKLVLRTKGVDRPGVWRLEGWSSDTDRCESFRPLKERICRTKADIVKARDRGGDVDCMMKGFSQLQGFASLADRSMKTLLNDPTLSREKILGLQKNLATTERGLEASWEAIRICELAPADRGRRMIIDSFGCHGEELLGEGE
jgi:hypothetical protein